MDQGPWFRPRRNGLGWTPITWQGWLVTILGAAIVIAIDLGLAFGRLRIPH